jgi:hypothetical protein
LSDPIESVNRPIMLHSGHENQSCSPGAVSSARMDAHSEGNSLMLC